ncbi:hypothetical protein, partial [uncultured Ruminococcus sp.]|uniref:hypothetical protein n=1 Tax=uncultured Ruminococcus sp. TaxID=165186 RepID=UPI002600A3A6
MTGYGSAEPYLVIVLYAGGTMEEHIKSYSTVKQQALKNKQALKKKQAVIAVIIVVIIAIAAVVLGIIKANTHKAWLE